MTETAKDETKRVCTTCVLCLRQDYGYTNHTMEGTTLSCLAGLNSALDGEEEPWRNVTPELAAALDVALTCPKYREGVPMWMDVDHEDLPSGKPVTPEIILATPYTDDAEAAELYARSRGWIPNA